MTCQKMEALKEAKDTFQALMELSRLLSTGLEPDILGICIRLCEAGMNPELLATILEALRKELQSIQESPSNGSEI